MDALFIKIFNLGVSAGWLVLAVLLLRPLTRKAPKWINCLLWGIVALRLCLPFSLESVFSLVPSAETLPPDVMMSPAPEINSGIGVVNGVINPIISTSLAPEPTASANPMQIVVAVAAWVWVIGLALMLGYGIVSYITLRLRVRVSVRGEDNLCFCDDVDSPFILGVIRPRIYVPSGMSGDALEHVLAHERAHLRRGDHLWKPLGFALLAIYWFNPLLWVAYALLCRDIEAACDEKVIKKMPDEAKKGYSEALLTCSLHRRRIMACPLAFGEVGVKQRIKSVLNYKKPAFWVIIAALIATLVLSVCFLTNPIRKPRELLTPSSEWTCKDGADVTLRTNYKGHLASGRLSFGSNECEITVYTRSAGLVRGTMLYVEIYENGRDEEGEPLLVGTMKARGGKLIFGIDEDNLGLDEKQLVFEKTKEAKLEPVPLEVDGATRYVRITDSGSDDPRLNISIAQVTRDGDDVIFVLHWKNKSLRSAGAGNSFDIYRYDGNGNRVKLEGVGYWTMEAHGVTREGTYMNYNITEHYDIFARGKYRFESDSAWVEFEVIEAANSKLAAKYPDYCLLDASKGLDVIVWQMAKGNYNFALLPHEESERDWLDSNLWNLKGVSADEMRAIISTYAISGDKIYVIPWQNPLSSYIGDYTDRWVALGDVTPYQEMYLAIVRDMIFGDDPKNNYPCIYESAYFDVDGDGKEETNKVCLGLVDGRFMFTYAVSEDGKTLEYREDFYTEPMSLKFFEDEGGKYFLRGKTDEGDVIIYDIAIENGHVKLTEKRYEQVTENELDLSKIELSLVDRIIVTNGMTGEQVYLRPYFNKESYYATLDAVWEIKATDPVSNRGYSGFTYNVKLCYDYQTIFSFALFPDTDGAYLICGYYETVGGFDYPARYKLTSPSYESLDEVLGKCFK